MTITGRTLIKEAAGPVAVAAVLAWALAVSWLKWPDVLIDFGKDVYFAWRITEGAVLYRDLAHFLGPLSPYLNALWFSVLGASLETIFIANFTVLLLLLGFAYGLMRYVGGAVSATAGAIAFVVAGAGAHLVAIGGYNFIAPNTHENTHSLLLAMVSLGGFAVFARTRGRLPLALAGVALGLTALTRPAPAVAVGLALGAGLFLSAWSRPRGWRDLPSDLLVVAAGGVMPPLVAIGLFALSMPPGDAARAVLSPWLVALDSEIRSLPTHRAGMGLDRVPEQLRAISRTGSAVALYFGGLFVIAWRGRPPRRFGPVAAGLVFVLLSGLLALSLRDPAGVVVWVEAARPLQAAMLAILVGLLVAVARARRRGAVDPRLIVAASLTVFALASLLKMILNVRIYQYGYVLATPALLVFVVAVTGWLPHLVRRLGGWRGLYAAGAFAALAVWLVAIQLVSLEQYQRKVYPVAYGEDRFFAGPRGRLVAAVLDELERRAAPGQTLAVVPEGAMLNFLSRRPNPTRFTNLMPVEFKLFGEEAIIDAYRARPPDFIVVAHKDTTEFGFRFFGTDYGQAFSPWLARNYRVVRLFGAPPLRGDRFGLALLERTPGSAGRDAP